MESARKMALLGCVASPGLTKQNPQECKAANSAEKTGLGQHFDVIVVNVVHKLAVIESLISRIHSDECAKSHAVDGMILKNVRCSANHRNAPAHGDFSNVQA